MTTTNKIAPVALVAALLGGTVGVGTLLYAFAIGPIAHLLLPPLTVPARPVATPGVPPAQVGT